MLPFHLDYNSNCSHNELNQLSRLCANTDTGSSTLSLRLSQNSPIQYTGYEKCS